VKLLSRQKTKYVFLLGKREREMMLMLLRMYPVLSSSYHNPSHDSKGLIDAELLEEALAEQRQSNKKALKNLLATPGCFVEDDLGFRFTVKRSEMEWLLQIFNDVRIGCWVKLGSPDQKTSFAPKLTEQNVQLLWAIEMAGLFEHEILEALNPS
jgi:hypothetical protein